MTVNSLRIIRTLRDLLGLWRGWVDHSKSGNHPLLYFFCNCPDKHFNVFLLVRKTWTPFRCLNDIEGKLLNTEFWNNPLRNNSLRCLSLNKREGSVFLPNCKMRIGEAGNGCNHGHCTCTVIYYCPLVQNTEGRSGYSPLFIVSRWSRPACLRWAKERGSDYIVQKLGLVSLSQSVFNGRTWSNMPGAHLSTLIHDYLSICLITIMLAWQQVPSNRCIKWLDICINSYYQNSSWVIPVSEVIPPQKGQEQR